MTAKNRPRLDVNALRELAGEKVFARGEAYHRDGRVTILSLEPGRALAQVEGTEDYRAALTWTGGRIGGECSCPAFEDWGVCKHMVAVALAASVADDDVVSGEAGGALARIRDHLKSKGVDALVEMILGLAERDAALFRKLDAAAAMVSADDTTIEARLRKAIDNATRTRGFVDYRAAAGWAEGVDAALDAVADLVTSERPGLALKLVERVIDRIELAIEDIDDSDGHCGTLLRRARDIHLAAAGATRPDPIELARVLFARELEGEYGTFDGAVSLCADVLGNKGLAEYRRLAAEAWEELPALPGGSAQHDETSWRCRSLQDILDIFAERDGDIDARIALRAKDLSSSWRYVELIEFCLAQGCEDEALRRAEEGLWVFEDGRPDEHLVFYAVDLLVKAGRKRDAEAHLWRAFEKGPSLALYARLREFGGKAARERGLAVLERLRKGEKARWQNPGDLLVRILAQEKMFDAAWGTVRKHGASVSVKEGLARVSEATHPREALEVYAERVDQLASIGGNPAYTEAAKLVARMAGLQEPVERSNYVEALKNRFGRKRNFMKLLG
jgi:hypothetical protein